MLIAETSRLDHAQHKSVLKSLKAHIASLKAALAAIEADIAQLVEESEMLRKKVALMQTVIGIGPISAMVARGRRAAGPNLVSKLLLMLFCVAQDTAAHHCIKLAAPRRRA